MQPDTIPFPAQKSAQPAYVGARTARDVVDWYLIQPGALGTSEESCKERKRILGLFSERYGDRPLEECRPFVLDDFINDQPGLKSLWTKKRWYGTILCAFNRAAERGVIDRNPFAGPRIPAGDDGRELTDLEFQAILRRARPEYRRVLIFLRMTGMRAGELRAATVAQVDLANRRILQQKHKTRAKTRLPRSIYLSQAALKLVKWLIPRAGPQGHLFLNSKGRPWSNSNMTKTFRRLRRQCGVAEDAKQHGNRHHSITDMLAKGVSPAIVAELHGHSGTQTLKRYSHLADKKQYLLDALDRAAKK